VSLTSPITLTLAWVVVPLIVVAASGGLGVGLQRLAGRPLGALLVPTGFLAGIALMTLLLEVGLSGVVTVVVCALAALAGPLERLRAGVRPRRPAWPGLRAAWPWAAAAGVAAYSIGIAPLVGSGRSGVVGYVLSNDPAVHVSSIQLLLAHGAEVVDHRASSFQYISIQFGGGYPLGSYTWGLFGTALTGVDPFHTWTPMIALSAAMTALTGFAVLRRLGAAVPLAAVAGAVVASGYLPYSYLAQGSAKEVMLATAVYASVALFAIAVEEGLTVRGLIPTAAAVAAAVAVFGPGALAFLGPGAVVGAGLALLLAGRAARVRTAVALSVTTLLTFAASAPALVSATRFTQASETATRDVNQIGNLLGPIPFREVFNVWLSGDYRFLTPRHPGPTTLGIVLAALLAVAGVAYAIRRRRFAVPLALICGASGALAISLRYSIYFDAKSYAVLAPAVGLATAAGVAALVASPRLRTGGIVAGVLLATLVLASDALVYRSAWVTPKDRFQELIDLNERYAGQGPILVNEREEYARHLLRDVAPWESWGGPWQPDRGLRELGDAISVLHTPDFDDYRQDFFPRFRLLLDRKRPGGSRPPAGFETVEETPHYRVWRRSGPLPRRHVPLRSGEVDDTGVLDCAQPEVADLLAVARAEGAAVRVSERAPPVDSPIPTRWTWISRIGGGVTDEFVTSDGGFAIPRPPLAPGRYVAWLRGAFGPGRRVFQGNRPVGEVFGDLGLPSQWFRIGEFEVRRPGEPLTVLGLRKPVWQAGSERDDLVGTLAIERAGAEAAVRMVPPAELDSLCGRRLDWIELP
jgi:hypothetical protein